MIPPEKCQNLSNILIFGRVPFVPVLKEKNLPLYLEYVAFARNDGIERGSHKEAEDEPREQACNDHNCEWLLSIRADPGGKCRRQESEARDEGRHHDGPQSQ